MPLHYPVHPWGRWINPEPPVMWGSGDSDMLNYAPICGTILQVSTLAELTAAVDKMLVGVKIPP